MSGLVRGPLEEALSQALLERAQDGSPAAVEPLVGAVADWLEGIAVGEEVTRLTRQVRCDDGVQLSPYWSGRTVEGLGLMLRRRL